MRYNQIRRSLTADNKIDSTGGGYITPLDPIATTLKCRVLQGEVPRRTLLLHLTFESALCLSISDDWAEMEQSYTSEPMLVASPEHDTNIAETARKIRSRPAL